MDITPQDDTATQSISDDQELAKALAGIADEPEVTAPAIVAPTPVIVRTIPTPEDPVDPSALIVPPVVVTPQEPATPEFIESAIPPVTETSEPAPTTEQDDELSNLKQSALLELRPLIDRVELPADEKFDTYLMLIRSTDDISLIAPAHAAAIAITDEKRKAQALLDIIKEIDFLSTPITPEA